MSPHDGAVDEDLFEIRILAQDSKDIVPDIFVGPPCEANIGAVP
jgi:hypothetical protein